MNKIKILLLIVIFSLPIFGQDSHGKPKAEQDSEQTELSSDFTFKKDGEDSPVYQVLPSDEKILSQADLGNAFQSLGIIAQPDEEKFGVMFVNAQTEFQFDDQIDKPFNFFIGQIKITGSNPKVIKKYKSKKLHVEYLTVSLTREQFEQLAAANNILIVFGSINYDVPLSNLQAFRYTQRQIKSDYEARTNRTTRTRTQEPTNSTGDVQVKGYYRRDGTYVRPYKRSRPKKN